MATASADVTAALATLRSRWGAAAPRRGIKGDLRPGQAETDGALAIAPLPADVPGDLPSPPERSGDVVSTGFPALDAILGPGGVPVASTVAFCGAGSSGATTLALRLVAEAQAAGSLVAWVDVGAALDPVDAVARGVRLDELAILAPVSLEEAVTMSGTLLQARAVDVVVLDLGPGTARLRGPRQATLAERFRRLAAVARRSGALLLVIEPPEVPAGLDGAVAEAASLRLELARRAWIRLGRDVVGQWTDALIGRSRYGPPGRQAALRILYADGGRRDPCLQQTELLSTDAPAPSPLAAPAAPARPEAGPRRRLRLVSVGPDRPRRPAVDRRNGPRREPRGTRGRRPTGDPVGHRPSPLPRGDVPRLGA
jgi:RecA/RadA recombinase